MNISAIDQIVVANTLGECVLWCEQQQCLWWTDIQESKLYRLSWPSKKLQCFETPERLCAFALTEEETVFIAAFETGFASYNWQTGEVDWLYRLFDKGSGIRLNDGRVDGDGRFWCGAMIEANHQNFTDGASLYSLESNGELIQHFSGIDISNGICTSPDNTEFYFADSVKRSIHRFDLDKGKLKNPQQIVSTEEGASPDGSVTDDSGVLWNAQWGTGKLLAYDRDGKILLERQCPVSQMSCLCFGGPNMDLIFATSAHDGLSSQQLNQEQGAGDLFVFKSSSRGQLSHRFRLKALRSQ